MSIIAGAVAGACGAVASQPLDTTFARVETAKKGQDTGVLATFRRVVDEEGFNALYAGLAPRMFFAAALLAIEFAIFEALRDAFPCSGDFATPDARRRPCGRRRTPALLDSAAQAAAQVDQRAHMVDIFFRGSSPSATPTIRPKAPHPPGRVGLGVSSRAARPIATAARWARWRRKTAALQHDAIDATRQPEGKGQHAHAVEASKGQRKHPKA